MSSLLAFKAVVDRAKLKEESIKSLLETASINVPVSVLTFANTHIDMLEEQLHESRNRQDKQARMISRMRGILVNDEYASVKLASDIEQMLDELWKTI